MHGPGAHSSWVLKLHAVNCHDELSGSYPMDTSRYRLLVLFRGCQNMRLMRSVGEIPGNRLVQAVSVGIHGRKLRLWEQSPCKEVISLR